MPATNGCTLTRYRHSRACAVSSAKAWRARRRQESCPAAHIRGVQGTYAQPVEALPSESGQHRGPHHLGAVIPHIVDLANGLLNSAT